MKKSELKQIIKEIISEDIFLQNRKSKKEKQQNLYHELDSSCKKEFGVEIYNGDITLTKYTLPYFKKYSKIKRVNGYFDCSKLKLTSLTELPIPEYISKDFHCEKNRLTSLEGAPKYVGGSFWCANKHDFSRRDVEQVCNVNGLIFAF